MIRELNVAFESIWEELLQELINKTIKNFTKKIRACATNGVDTPNTSREGAPGLFDNDYSRVDLGKQFPPTFR